MSRDEARRRTDPRARLTREQVVQAALQLLDAEGLDRLTMRRLADRLGVAPMTLYGYVQDKDALLDAVLDHAMSSVVVDTSGDHWRERVRSLFLQMFRQLVRHPFVVQLRFRRPILNAGSLRFPDRGMAVLMEAGLDADRAAAAFRSMFIYTFGSAAFGAPTDLEGHRAGARVAMVAAAAEDDELSTVPGVVDAMVETLGGEAQFAYGLDRLLDGVARDVDASAGRAADTPRDVRITD